MKTELQQVTDWLLCASSQITSPYFVLPIANDTEDRYRERVYCYELYHHWRNHWPNGFRFSLNGEVDKISHPLIPYKKKPDFLVHVPGEMTDTSNLLIMEVKGARSSEEKMDEDLNKLMDFRSDLKDKNGDPANYHAAYFWIYGLRVTDWPALRNKLLRNSIIRNLDKSLVTCFIHEQCGIKATLVKWDE